MKKIFKKFPVNIFAADFFRELSSEMNRMRSGRHLVENMKTKQIYYRKRKF